MIVKKEDDLFFAWNAILWFFLQFPGPSWLYDKYDITWGCHTFKLYMINLSYTCNLSGVCPHRSQGGHMYFVNIHTAIGPCCVSVFVQSMDMNCCVYTHSICTIQVLVLKETHRSYGLTQTGHVSTTILHQSTTGQW